MNSVTRRPLRPADVPRDTDWAMLAEDIYQGELVLEPELRSAWSPADIAREALAHLAVTAALVERLQADRTEWIRLALAHGASTADIAAAMGITVADLAEILAETQR